MQANTNVVNLGEKDIRQRLVEVMQRFGYKQVDVSKETGTLALMHRHPPFYAQSMASRKDQRPLCEDRRDHRRVATERTN